MGVDLRAKFQVSNIILTSFRQGVILPQRAPEKPTQTKVRESLIWILC